MILSALNNYYQILLQNNSNIPKFGYSTEKISYALLLNKNGELIKEPQDIRRIGKSKSFPKNLTVPAAQKRSINIAPNFLWDNSKYILGIADGAKGKEPFKKTQDEFIASKKFHQNILKDTKSEALRAVYNFFDWWTPEKFRKFSNSNQKEYFGANFVFQLEGEKNYVHDSAEAKKLQEKNASNNKIAENCLCLITGQSEPLELCHPSIKNIKGAQSFGANIVSYNQDAFCSYGKKQGGNAPISKSAAFGYTTALNYLLRQTKDNQQRLNIGDTTIVFWAESKSNKAQKAAENIFANLLNPLPNNESETHKLKLVLDSVAKGYPLKNLGLDLADDTKLFVLGLSPNSARISIRYWYTDQLKKFAYSLAQHYCDLKLKPNTYKKPLSVDLLTKILSKDKIFSPKLIGDFIDAILTGCCYPRTLLSTTINRIRNDSSEKAHQYFELRVALCKAILTRERRIKTGNNNDVELLMSLDKNNTNEAYLLGRLFCVLENIQQSALGRDINTTIRSQYYTSASTTPNIIFPTLLKKAQHHLEKLRKNDGKEYPYLDSQLAKIIEDITPPFPHFFDLENQGYFVIGYYHQKTSEKNHSAKNIKLESDILNN